MVPLKHRISDEKTLQSIIDAERTLLVGEVRQAVGAIEDDYMRYRWRHRVGIGLQVVAVFVVWLFTSEINLFQYVYGPRALLLGVVFFLVVIVCGYAGIRFSFAGRKIVHAFHQGVDTVLFGRALALVGLEGSLLPSPEHPHDVDTSLSAFFKKLGTFRVAKTTAEPTALLAEPVQYSDQVLALLEHSELITESRNTILIDNLLHTTHRDRTLFIAELDVSHVTRSGKSTRTKHLFKGYFAAFDLARTLDGKTFVSTEGDRNGFGHQSFWKQLMGNRAVHETQLEWNEFENLLHVVTTHGAEARYVLTTDFMHDLYEWWKTKKRNIRVSFIQNRMYILFPDADIRLHDTVPKIQEKDLAEYLYTIARPLMHVVHLIEDVRL